MMLNFRTSCWSSFHTIAGRCMLRGASKTGSKLKFPQQQYQQYWNTSSQQSKGRLYGDRLPHGSFKGKAGKTLSKLKNKPHLLVLFGIAAVFFQLALDKVPISGRWRMNFISNRFLEALKPAPLLDRIKSSEKTVLPDTTPEVKLIQKVFDRLILCNDLQHVMSSMKILVNTSSDSIPFAGVMRESVRTCQLLHFLMRQQHNHH